MLEYVGSFAVQNTYFFHKWDLERHNQTFPSFLDLKHRTAKFSPLGHSVKSFVNTRVARTVFNHYALSKYIIVKASSPFLF